MFFEAQAYDGIRTKHKNYRKICNEDTVMEAEIKTMKNS